MTPFCDREEEVVAAAIDGHLDTFLSEHVNGCESCRVAVAMISLFQTDNVYTQETATNNRVPDVIWAKATYALRKRRERKRKSGLAVGAISGMVVGYLTSVIIAPENLSFSFGRIESFFMHTLSLLWPVVFILLAAMFVLYGNTADSPVPKNR